MEWFDAFILGLIQGLAEYLPISSSGHLEIGQKLLNLNIAGADSLAFDVTLHVATVLSTIVILWREFSGICTSFFTWRRDENFSLLMKILVSCIPVGIVGIAFKKHIEAFFGSNLLVVGSCLCVTAALLAFAYFYRTRPLMSRYKGVSTEDAGRPINYIDAFIIGCAQAIAVLPGLSRSGSTIATGIILGNKRGQLARFSFLMVIIPILGQALLDIVKNVTHPEEMANAAVGLVPLAVGFVTAFVVGCLACRWMIDLVKKGKLIWFAVYCLAVGAICLIMH